MSMREHATPKQAYNRARLALILVVMAGNLFFAVVNVVDRRYPWGIAPVLFLAPCLLRELDLRSGCKPRRFGSFEWSCFAGGFVFQFCLPIFIR